MHRLLGLFGLLLVALPAVSQDFLKEGQAYQAHYSSSCQEAWAFVDQHRPHWQKQALELGLTKAEFRSALALVLPEITRYMGYQGFLEEVYVNMTGSLWIKQDISIGPLQLKSAFVQELAAAEYDNPSAQAFAKQVRTMDAEAQKALITDPKRMFRLACLFFLHQKQQANHADLQLLAFRFNAGLGAHSASLEHYLNQKQFPHGPGSSAPQYNYARLVQYFHHQLNAHH